MRITVPRWKPCALVFRDTKNLKMMRAGRLPTAVVAQGAKDQFRKLKVVTV